MRRNSDLLAVTVCVVVSLSIFALVDDAFARVAPALAMVLVVPGYALSVWLFPSPTLARLERLLLSVGLSLSTAILVALVLDRAGHLTARAWADALATVAAVAVGGSAWRRRDAATRSDGQAPLRIALGPLLTGSVAIAAAVASVVAAIAMARVPESHARGSTVLWARAENRALGTYAVGIKSSELRATTYVLTGTVDGKVVLRRTLSLPSGGDWQTAGTVGRSPAGSGILLLSLYEQSAPTVLYRHVALTFGTSGI